MGGAVDDQPRPTAQHSNRRVQCPRHAAISSPRLPASLPVAPPWPWLFPPAPFLWTILKATESYAKPRMTSLRSMQLSTDFKAKAAALQIGELFDDYERHQEIALSLAEDITALG